jgi:type IV pilus assembly protein PilQ
MYQNKSIKSLTKSKSKLLLLSFVLIATAAALGDIEQIPKDGGTIQSITFDKDSKIKDGLRVLSAMYKKNIVPSENVEGVIGFTRLYNVTFEEAMDAILGANFKYEQDGQLIKVYAKEEYKKIKEDKDRMTYKVFTLYYITAAEAVKLVTPVLSSDGRITASSAAETGISMGRDGISGKVGGDSITMNDTIVVYDYPENIAKVAEVIESIDVRPKQILIEATILSATLTDTMKVGIDWNLLRGVNLDGTDAKAAVYSETTGAIIEPAVAKTTPLEQIAAKVVGEAIETTGFANPTIGGLRIGIRTGDLAALITALETVTDVTVLANPKILALNKQVGTVFIGAKIGYKSQTTQTDTSTTQKVEFLDTGTKLSFRPYIADDGYIRMDIYPKDSSGTLSADGIPTETTAELTSNIMVKDGQTIVIGGLFRDDVTSSKSQVPFLGDLPLIGAAFRGVSDTSKRQEVIVLLTPHIIKEPEETDGDARAADVSRKRIGAREALQWTTRSRLAEDSYSKAVEYYLKGKKKAALDKLNWALVAQPTYLEALRLKERIISETSPDGSATIERVMLDVIEREESSKWLRR